jgi:hypothetical protein
MENMITITMKNKLQNSLRTHCMNGNSYNINKDIQRHISKPLKKKFRIIDVSLLSYKFEMPIGMTVMPIKLFKKCELERIPLDIYVYELDQLMFDELFEHTVFFYTPCNAPTKRPLIELTFAEPFQRTIKIELTNLFFDDLVGDGLLESTTELIYLVENMYKQMLYLACTNYPLEGYNVKYKSDSLSGIGKLFDNWRPIITPLNTFTYEKYCTRLLEIACAMKRMVIRFRDDIERGEPTLFY